MNRYEFALEAHSTLRLALLLACVFLFFIGLRGWMGKRGPSSLGKLFFLLATIFADLQLVLGLLLYFGLSPYTSQARANFGAAMKDPTLRFWAVEHASAMLAVVACVHMGKVFSGRATSDASRHRHTWLWSGIALALILLVTPWPFSEILRPYWRLGAP